MNRKGWSINNLSAPAVAVLVAAFMIATGQVWWGVGFIILAIVLAIISSRNKED